LINRPYHDLLIYNLGYKTFNLAYLIILERKKAKKKWDKVTEITTNAPKSPANASGSTGTPTPSTA